MSKESMASAALRPEAGSPPKAEVVHVSPGESIDLRFECKRCESMRWPCVVPARNIRRAITALNEGREDDARDFLLDAFEELAHYAQWPDEVARELQENAANPDPQEETEA